MTNVVAARTAAEIDAQTPPTRDRVIDFLRAASLVVVIVGHWLMATVSYTDGAVIGSNVLAQLPVLHPVTWILQVMPLFFVAGGFANLTSWHKARSRGEGYAAYLDRRLRRLLGPTIAFVVAAPIGVICLEMAGVGAAEREIVAALLGSPLWFLGVFVATTALAPIMAAAHERRPIATTAALLVSGVVIDLGRLIWSSQVGYLNLLIAWLFVQQLGFWYASEKARRLRPPTLAAVVIGALVALILLTGPGPYPVSMVGLPGEMSNMAPPSVCLLILAIGQMAVILLVRRRLAAWLQRSRPWRGVIAIGSMAMSLYLWHLAVLVVGFGVIAGIGVRLPEAGSMLWWLSRPLWLALLAAVLVPAAAALARLERVRPAPTSGEATGPGPLVVGSNLHSWQIVRSAAGVVSAVAGLFGFVLNGLAPTLFTALCVVAVLAGGVLTRRVVPTPTIRE